MKSIIFAILFCSSAFGVNALTKKGANVMMKPNMTLEELVRDYAKIKNMNLSLPDQFAKSKVDVYGPKTLGEKQLKNFVDFALFEAGYSSLFSEDTNTLTVFNARDVRYGPLETYKDITQVPNTFQYAQFAYNMKYASASDLARNMRPFLSRYGRVIDATQGKSLILAETGKNIHRIHDLLKLIDTKEFKKERDMASKVNEKAVIKLKEKSGLLEVLTEQHALFIIVFSLISGILGFIIRGYAIKRIEGGW